MENYKKKAIELLMGLCIDEAPNPAVIKAAPTKIAISGREEKCFKRRIGGRRGEYSSELISLLSELETENRVNLHSMLIIKDGEAILDVSSPCYDSGIYHLAHSMTKTVTAIAIGILIDDGLLTEDMRLVDIFPEIIPSDGRFSLITVKDLLTMKAGVKFAEVGTVTEEDWLEGFFKSEMDATPGSVFQYNSMNSYILSRIISRISGKETGEFIKERIFDKLGIRNYLIESCPKGYAKGGFGLYLSTQSFAKIGMMLLGEGEFGTQRILSREFVLRMRETHSYADINKGAFNYGYHIWVAREGDDFMLSGMLGQMVWISPSDNIVVAVNSGNNELFQKSPTLDIIRKHLIGIKPKVGSLSDTRELKKLVRHFGEARHFVKYKSPEHGLLALLGIKERYPYDTRWDAILGSYAFCDNNYGTLPSFVRVMQNNYSGGLEKITLAKEKNRILLTAFEGGKARSIPIGLYGYEESIQDYNGEKYILRASGEAGEDENRSPVYKIELAFPELPNTLMLKISAAAGGIKLRLSEMPNDEVASAFLTSFTENAKFGLILGLFEKKTGEGFISQKIHNFFNPTLFGIDTKTEGYEFILAENNRRLKESRESSGKFIKGLVQKFIVSDGEKKKEESAPNIIGGFISSLFGKAMNLFGFGKGNSDSDNAN